MGVSNPRDDRVERNLGIAVAVETDWFIEVLSQF